jgi:hypothetical protein
LTGGYQLGFAIAAAVVATGLLIVVVVLRSPGGRGIQVAITRPTSDERTAEAA